MEELSRALDKWDRKSVFLLRIDYGYPVPLKADRTIDCSAVPPSDVLEAAPAFARPAVCRIVSPQFAFSSRRRTREGGGASAVPLRDSAVIIETRFPKTFRSVRDYLEKENVRHTSYEARHDGSLPPLYRQLRPGSDLFELHLSREWETGLCMARGTSVIVEAGSLISKSAEPVAAGALAKEMGITTGAAASYLRWMEDAALVRRVGKGYLLRHEGLYLLFRGRPERQARERVVKKSDPMDLD
ncbi:MAG TPA: hypothetical protein PK747_11000 [Acidobacteriota bacterium]|jgi:hypothetical protein|nr:hypothetical protein [Acidobacteriota bacterium]HNT16429.1 hypothetical protein [Acidobacteriota bacterium]HPA27864.1 hypothetical protein [Acidobacteriota bacterium]HQO20043.1 hypothetical protein [Acidobacteriota bacterium]HQQ47918.1 hypothetical protein [Acidobacteriota bacterium]